MDLCVSCKGCKRECPTGVDMAKMKIEFLHHYRKRHGLRLQGPVGRLSAALRAVGGAIRVAREFARHGAGIRARVGEMAGFQRAALAAAMARRHVFARPGSTRGGGTINGEVVLLVDTFNNYFEPENARAALAVLRAAGYLVHLPRARDGARPLCCGRTFLAAGLVDEARAEAQRMIAELTPFIKRGVPVIGLEPACLLGLRDEFLSMLPGADSAALALNAMLFEEFLAREADAGRLKLKLEGLAAEKSAAARPLSPEGIRRDAGGAQGAETRART